MTKDPWLPIGFEFPDGEGCRALLYENEKWQIFNTEQENSVLVVQPELAHRWIEACLMEEAVFKAFTFGKNKYYALLSPDKYELIPVAKANSPENKADALAFAVSLFETRRIVKEISLHDSIYVEKLSRLLPTWTISSQVSDDLVLGTWLTGGVSVSVLSFRRLFALTGWLSPEHLQDVLETAGYKGGNNFSETVSSTIPRDHSDENGASIGQNVIQSDKNHVNQRRFSLPGRPNLEAFINEHVIDIIFNPDKYQALGINFPSSIVLHGPPGCGKTFAVEQMVEFIDWPSFSIDSNTIGSPYIHATSKKISEVFDKAIDMAPSVITIDEMDSFLSDRQNNGSSGNYHVEEVAEFLRRIPEAGNNKVLIIGMTNRIDAVDPAILRRGRFDHIIEVGMPSREEVKSLILFLLSDIPTSDSIDISPILDELTNRSLSDSSFVIREAARLSAKDGKTRIDNGSLKKALQSLLASEDSNKQPRKIGFVRS